MADDIFGRGKDRQVDALVERGEEIGRRPGVIEQRDDLALALMRLRGGADGGDVRHFKGQAARAFEQDRAGALAEQVGICPHRSADRR
jgi:hypothetical protein